MRYLEGSEEKEGFSFLDAAAEEARKSTCLRAHCGTVIVKNDEIIGRGYNSPPLNSEENRTCLNEYDLPKNWRYDRTCCMHAEERAVMDAIRNKSDRIIGSRLYFVRINEEGKRKASGQPYCTICGRMALDAGITEFVLWHEAGICVYDTAEYDRLSFKNLK